MNTEIFKQLDFLRDECLANFRERSNTFTEESVESMYNNTKDIITDLLEARHSNPLSIDIIKTHMSQIDFIEWQQIEVWLFQLTDMDDSFVYAYNHLAQRFNKENGCAMYKLKEISTNELRMLLENKTPDSTKRLQRLDKKMNRNNINASISFVDLDRIYAILSRYFPDDQKKELYDLLEHGHKPNRKLFFNASGNRLTDFFKELIEHDFIIGINKIILEEWIVENFTFLKRETESDFNIDTVRKNISRKVTPCVSPIIKITDGVIEAVHTPKRRKDNNR